MKKAALLYTFSLALLLGAPAVQAQHQPAEAGNSQDEIVNLDRPVDPNTDTFKILRSDSKLETNRYVTKVYTLKYANPYEVLPYIRKAVTLEKGTVATASVKDPATGKDRMWIQVNVPEFMIPSVDQAVAAYDVPDFKSSPGDVRMSYRTKYRSAKDVADFIRTSDLSPDGYIYSDNDTNTIYLADSPSDFKRITATLQFFDVPVPQIDLEVRAIELTELNNTSLGLYWDAWKSSIGGALSGQVTYSKGDNGAISRTNTQNFTGLVSVGAETLAEFLNYLTDEGKAEVHAQTHLTVSSGQMATLSSQTDVPEYHYVKETTGNGTNTAVQKDLEEVPPTVADPKAEGISLSFTPTVALNSTRLDVKVDMSNPVGIGKTGSPIYSTQEVKANLTVDDGQLYKVGGLRRGVVTNQTRGIPGLRSVPGLKFFFSNEAQILRETELYVFLRPTWTAPKVSAEQALSGVAIMKIDSVSGLLKNNPNISISPEDQAILEDYFNNEQPACAAPPCVPAPAEAAPAK